MIIKAGQSEIPIIRQLSERIWMDYYPAIISVDQIRYMLDKMYSEVSLLEQMNVMGHQFLLLMDENHPAGYASFSRKNNESPHRFRLHKLYVRTELHGRGRGKELLQYISKEVVSAGGKELELNVNKRNPAIGFYTKMGFRVESEALIDIGNSFFMDDFIMVLDV